MTVRTLDLRELADEWQEATDLLEDGAEGQDPDDIEEARETDRKFHALCDELGIDPNNEPSTLRWHGDNYEPTLIEEDSFEEYAEELAIELGFIDDERASRWPFNHIDWAAAADELKTDYTTVEYDGDTYYIRSC